MEKKVLSFDQFINEQTNSEETVGTSGTETSDFQRPETEREARSRIAASLVKSVFGDKIQGITGGSDDAIEETPEVKQSLPYKGCGINDPYPLKKTPIPVSGLKAILEHLQEKGVADYSRTITELNEKRAIIIGFRNNIDVKKESSNQDRFCDSLYFVPGGANQGSLISKSSTGATGSGDKAKENKDKKKNQPDVNKQDILARLGKGKSKNEAIEIIEDRIRDIKYIYESSVWGFGEFDSLRNELEFLSESLDELSSETITVEQFVRIYEEDKKDKSNDVNKSATGSTGSTGSTGEAGDMITPYQITTVPSLAYYGKKPLNPKGVGIKLPGDTIYLFQESTLGSQKYKMMVEAEKVKVGRYPIGVTKYETYKPAEVYTENCGMQIHRSSTKGVGVCIGPWSAGCQVFSDYTEWQEFVSKAEKESMNASKFLYALIQLDDIDPKVLESAIKGEKYSPAGVPVKNKQEDNKSKEDIKKEERKDAEKLNKIQQLAKYIKDEKGKANSNEEETIKKYNQTITSNDDWNILQQVYKNVDSKSISVWTALQSYLSDSEFDKLKFKSKKII